MPPHMCHLLTNCVGQCWVTILMESMWLTLVMPRPGPLLHTHQCSNTFGVASSHLGMRKTSSRLMILLRVIHQTSNIVMNALIDA